MKPKSIKIQRTESLLKELIPEALASLAEEGISTLSITEVDCSRGKYDADVYIDPSFLTPAEQTIVLQQLKYASSLIEEYCLAQTGWYRCPRFHYKFDDSVERISRLEKIFDQIGSKK